MTSEEARKLAVGDRVEILTTRHGLGHRWFPAVVTRVDPINHYMGIGAPIHPLIWARPIGTTKGGRRCSVRSFLSPDQVRLPPPHDPLSAAIYADFLEEHGHAEAANLLRQAFPLAP